MYRHRLSKPAILESAFDTREMRARDSRADHQLGHRSRRAIGQAIVPASPLQSLRKRDLAVDVDLASVSERQGKVFCQGDIT